MPIDQLLSSLPPEILEGRSMTPMSSQEEGEGEGGEEPMEAEASGGSVLGKAPVTRKEVAAVKERRTRCGVHISNSCAGLSWCVSTSCSLSLLQSPQERVARVDKGEW